MTTLPRSGKSGFVIGRDSLGTPVHTPIYSWNYSERQLRAMYRTSRSSNLPVRTPGVFEEVLTIRGAGYPRVLSFISALMVFGVYEFDLGWYNLPSTKIQTTIKAILAELRFEFNYSRTVTPAFMWTATFVGVEYTTLLVEYPITPYISDSPLCFNKQCTQLIDTTDSAGILSHIRSAVWIETREALNYRTSRSKQKIVSSNGVSDVRVSLIVDGDFDYWLDKLSLNAGASDYKLFYGPGALEYINAEKMVVESFDNLNVNVQTGELISATVNLGALA